MQMLAGASVVALFAWILYRVFGPKPVVAT
jgi:hypothetical protein